MGFRSHLYGMRPETHGFSHGLSNSPPDCLIPSLRSGRPFESRHSSKKSGDCGCSHRIFGRSVGIRTRGLLDPNQARYQASPHPEILIIIADSSLYVNQNYSVTAKNVFFFPVHRKRAGFSPALRLIFSAFRSSGAAWTGHRSARPACRSSRRRPPPYHREWSPHPWPFPRWPSYNAQNPPG